jgi:peptidylamidoglycolate lyase
MGPIMISKRKFLKQAGSAALAVGAGLSTSACGAPPGREDPADDGEVLGQGTFRYRLVRGWGHLDRSVVPVEDCHAITENREGQIVLLTNQPQHNVIVYTKDGEFVSKRENRFPKAHALEFIDNGSGDERLWLTDHGICVVSLLAPDGREERRITPEIVSHKYPDISRYSPTNVAVMPDGDFFVSDGYGSHYIHHFDPEWRYISSFGGAGTSPEHLRQPHAVYLDTRRGPAELLVCDRANQQLKWFAPDGELLRTVPVPGSQPSNVAPMANDHLAIACLNGMILVLDRHDQIVSAVGGETPHYVDGTLQPLVNYNTVFNHPHDVYVDADGAMYVAQWNSNRTYPLKLSPA